MYLKLISFFAILAILYWRFNTFNPELISKDYACQKNYDVNYYGNGALLASRFETLEDLKKVVTIEYEADYDVSNPQEKGNSCVKLTHCSHEDKVVSVLKSGVNQNQITDAYYGSYLDKLLLLMKSPETFNFRFNTKKTFFLARRIDHGYGENDIAFFDLAIETENRIIEEEGVYLNARDSSEKGYLNTFNHITAQAFMVACFSKEFADYISDVHERNNMAELTTGVFSQDQLSDENVNPIDNYIDMINNKWGQVLGQKFKQKHNVNEHTIWDEKLLTMFLNETLSYYSWAFNINFRPFKSSDILIQKYVKKINIVMSAR